MDQEEIQRQAAVASGMVELLHDCLSILQGDARRLVDSAMSNSLLTPLEANYREAMALAHRVARLSAKIDDMLVDMQPRVEMVVADAGHRLRQATGAKLN